MMLQNTISFHDSTVLLFDASYYDVSGWFEAANILTGNDDLEKFSLFLNGFNFNVHY